MMRRALPRRRTRLVLLAALAATLLALLVAAPGALADAFTPESGGSPQADDIDTLYKITLYVAIVIFLIVEGTLIWSLVRHRARRGGPEAVQIRGNTPLELGWTLGAALILVVLTVITFLYLDDIKNPPPSGPDGLASQSLFASIDQPRPPAGGGPTLNIEVDGPPVPLALRLPGRRAALQLLRDGGAHRHHRDARREGRGRDPLLVDPEAGRQGRRRARPREQDLVQDPARQGGRRTCGQCAELCGANHADMRAEVRAVTPDEFESWAQQQRADIKAAGEALGEQRKRREREGETE